MRGGDIVRVTASLHYSAGAGRRRAASAAVELLENAKTNREGAFLAKIFRFAKTPLAASSK
jgi:hypothetical protein